MIEFLVDDNLLVRLAVVRMGIAHECPPFLCDLHRIIERSEIVKQNFRIFRIALLFPSFLLPASIGTGSPVAFEDGIDQSFPQRKREWGSGLRW